MLCSFSGCLVGSLGGPAAGPFGGPSAGSFDGLSAGSFDGPSAGSFDGPSAGSFSGPSALLAEVSGLHCPPTDVSAQGDLSSALGALASVCCPLTGWCADRFATWLGGCVQ
jgi:hypothetical protein